MNSFLTKGWGFSLLFHHQSKLTIATWYKQLDYVLWGEKRVYNVKKKSDFTDSEESYDETDVNIFKRQKAQTFRDMLQPASPLSGGGSDKVLPVTITRSSLMYDKHCLGVSYFIFYNVVPDCCHWAPAIVTHFLLLNTVLLTLLPHVWPFYALKLKSTESVKWTEKQPTLLLYRDVLFWRIVISE